MDGRWTATAGSWRLPSQSLPVVLPDAGDHVVAGAALGSRQVEVVHEPAVVVVGLHADRPRGLGLQRLGDPRDRLAQRHRRRAEPLDEAVDRARDRDPDQAVAAPADVVGVAGQVA